MTSAAVTDMVGRAPYRPPRGQRVAGRREFPGQFVFAHDAAHDVEVAATLQAPWFARHQTPIYTPSDTVKVTSSSMSCRIECHTEQYFSRESWIARATGSSGMLPVIV